MKHIKLFESYEERYDKIERALHRHSFRNNQNTKPLIIFGRGSGKIYAIDSVLKEMDEDYVILHSSDFTPTSFYNLLYEHRDSVIVINEMYDNSSTNNEMRVNKIITQLCKKETITHPYPFAANPPQTVMQFEFTGRVILSVPDITNSPKGVDDYIDCVFLGYS